LALYLSRVRSSEVLDRETSLLLDARPFAIFTAFVHKVEALVRGHEHPTGVFIRANNRLRKVRLFHVQAKRGPYFRDLLLQLRHVIYGNIRFVFQHESWRALREGDFPDSEYFDLLAGR